MSVRWLSTPDDLSCEYHTTSIVNAGFASRAGNGYERVGSGTVVVTYRSMEPIDRIQVLHGQ